MPVITVSRLTGSGGATIGQRLAERLGASYLNTQIIREVAHRLGISEATAAEYNERAEAFIERLARVLWLSNPALAPISSPASSLPFESTTQAFVEVTRQLVREAARTGNAVIFGHGAQFILAEQPEVLHVRFIAPLAFRVEQVMHREEHQPCRGRAPGAGGRPAPGERHPPVLPGRLARAGSVPPDPEHRALGRGDLHPAGAPRRRRTHAATAW